MNCLSEEELIEFTINSLSEENFAENAEIAAHINECDVCRAKLREINDIILSDDYEITPDDVKEIDAFLAKRKSSRDVLSYILSVIKDYIFPASPETDNLTGISSTLYNLIPPLEMGMAALAAPTDFGRGEEERPPLKINFTSDCEKDNSKYWAAEMIVPFGIQSDTELVIFVTDRKGNFINKGTFVLLGNELEINDGMCTITLADFQKSLKNTVVKLVGSNGQESFGSLIII